MTGLPDVALAGVDRRVPRASPGDRGTLAGAAGCPAPIGTTGDTAAGKALDTLPGSGVNFPPSIDRGTGTATLIHQASRIRLRSVGNQTSYYYGPK